MSDDPKYDVAISFLAKDEATAKALADKLEAGGLSVFFFPRNQEELAGTNGMETMREPFFNSRVNVILFQTPWGQTPWTRVEQTAATERCLEKGWDSLMFVQLDKTSTVPKWLPRTHVRYALHAYGIEQLVGAIKARAQEQGGILAPANAISEAKRVQREADYLKDRDRMMRDRGWIENAVHCSLRETFKRASRLVEQVKKDHGFEITCGSHAYHSCVIRSGYVSVGIFWHQPIYNSVVNDRRDECCLRATEFSGTLLLPGERGWVMEQPRVVKEHKFDVDVTESRDLAWIERGKGDHVAPDQLADRLVMIMLDLISRANQGKVLKVPRPSL